MKHWFALHLFLGLLFLTETPVYAQDSKPVWGKTHLSVVLAVAFSPDGKWLASAGADQTIRIWSISGGKEWRTFKGHTEPINCLAFGRHGRTLASGSADGTIRLWELQGSRRVRTLPGEVGVDSLAFSPDGRWLVSGSADHTVKLWDIRLGQEARTLLPGGWYSSHFKPVLKASDARIIVWLVIGVNEIPNYGKTLTSFAVPRQAVSTPVAAVRQT